MITRQFFDRLFPTKGLSPAKYNLVRERDALIDELNRFLPKYQINTQKRIVAFFANCGIETDYFKTTIEYASGWDYDISRNPRKARELGNVEKGDGPKFKGSGLSQTTGKFNFEAVQKAIGEELGVDVVKNPELLREDIEIAVRSACIFWRDHKLNDWADAGAFKQLSAIVNRGDKSKVPLHWGKRLALYKTLLSKVPSGIVLIEDLPSNKEVEPPQQLAPEPQTDTSLVSNESSSTESANTVSADTPSAEGMSLRSFSNKYLRHTPGDKVKQIALVVSGRVGTGLFTIWNLGIGGKLLTVLIALIILGPIAYTVYTYRWRIVGWFQTIADTMLGNS